ncbi:MAG: polysaccharide deacetylase family protein [Candidatus Nitrosocosmicus sp.]
MLSFSFNTSYSTGQITLLPPSPIQYTNNSTKLIILAFDDSSKTEFNLAKPVLDKYGFKGSFFTVCSFVDKGSSGVDYSRMSWQDIKTLQQQGHDIESHTMTHTDLNHKSPEQLVYEIGGSKQCLLNHGINSTIFAYPESSGGKNATVIDVVAKYYDLARVGDAPMAFLDCNGYKKESNCQPIIKNGTLTYENRYDIRNWSDRPKLTLPESIQTGVIAYNNVQMLNQFIHEVNLQSFYNKNGCIETIPIVVYHNFLIGNNHQYLSDESFTDVNLFEYEMKYLQDNGFKVLKMSDLTFDPISKDLNIKGYPNLKNC